MQTIIVTLNIKKLAKIDFGIHDCIVERVSEVSSGTVVDGENGYFSPTGVGVWLAAENAKEGAELLVKLFESEKFCGNDLTKAAEIYISDSEKALLFDCERVYPAE